MASIGIPAWGVSYRLSSLQVGGCKSGAPEIFQIVAIPLDGIAWLSHNSISSRRLRSRRKRRGLLKICRLRHTRSLYPRYDRATLRKAFETNSTLYNLK